MPHGRDALAARFTRAWSANADAPTIAIHLKPWRGRSRTYRTAFLTRPHGLLCRRHALRSAKRHPAVAAAMPWPHPMRTHPHFMLFIGRQDHRHCLGVNRFNGRVRRSGQKAVNKVRSEDWFRLGPTVASELGPDSGKGKQGPMVIEREPHNVLCRSQDWAPAHIRRNC